MEYIIKYLIMAVIYIAAFLLVSNLKKISNATYNCLEKIIPPVIAYPILFFFIHLVMKYLNFPKELVSSQLMWNIIVIFFYSFMILATIVGLIEKIAEYAKNSISFTKLVINIFVILFSLSISYSVVYFVIYDLYPESFINVSNKNIFHTFIDLFYYSFGVMTTAGNSNIIPNDVITKSFTILEITTSFLFIIILIANYKQIGDIYNKKD